MKANRARWPIATMARLLQVSSSGYYAWLRREPSRRALADAQLLARIRTLHASSRGTYGAPRIHAQLAREGVHVGRKRVARLMRMAGLCGASRRRGKGTTHPRAGARRAPDLVRRHFSAEAANVLWVADATYIPTGEGFLYLAVVLDVFSRRIVGWAMSSHLYTELMLRALDMALLQRRPDGVIHHSDQGCQYTSIAFGRRCREAGVQPSMGTAGDCYDNAMCESFFGTLEAELLDREHFGTHEQARRRIFWYLESWYNLRRLHSSLRYRSPLEFEQLHAQTPTSSQRGLPTDGQRHGRERRPAARRWTTRSSTLNGG
ncbi:integrase catalytic region [Paraburkholderia caribensis MBA4]|uniref:Integrase catalytic region n=1 Tax=Paraburkholderia caribensis MBA4 TaxID=1323664 RepID=A0A0P0R7E2_9BURK|nr:integrase catalytic region [Paraburkholderia caribensis MBA4]